MNRPTPFRKPIRQRSAKMAKLYVERRKFVAEFLAKHPWCQRCESLWVNPETDTVNRPTEVHEVISRARGGDILDEDNCRALCHKCHFWITTHPAQATAEGWLKSGKKQFSF